MEKKEEKEGRLATWLYPMEGSVKCKWELGVDSLPFCHFSRLGRPLLQPSEDAGICLSYIFYFLASQKSNLSRITGNEITTMVMWKEKFGSSAGAAC